MLSKIAGWEVTDSSIGEMEVPNGCSLETIDNDGSFAVNLKHDP